MIDKIRGKILAASGKSIICNVGPIDLWLGANPLDFKINEETEIFVYFNWSSENGPSFFGFCSDEIRQTFKSLINCQKIGPSLAMQILSQVSPAMLFKLINSSDEKNLAKINGIGPKSAKILISSLQNENLSFINSAAQMSDQEKNIFDVKEALLSLGYLGGDIAKIISELSKNSHLVSFDQILRQALSLLQRS